MAYRLRYLVLLSVLLFTLTFTLSVRAESVRLPGLQVNAFDLVNAVNALRASYGLPAYSISPILMFTAQNQADFMAANGIVTHSGPGGVGLTDRLLAAGYPLAGDLSLGGFRAENVTAINNGSAEDAVTAWMGDAPHQNTMLSPNLTEIGAGVAIVNGRVYFVIDTARPTTSGAPQAATQIVGSGTAVPAAEAVVYPVTLSTPNADGQVIHEVLSGQTLWQIAISYDVKIDEIKRLNNLFADDIYPGEKLLVKMEAAPIPMTPTGTPLVGETPLLSLAESTATLPLEIIVTATQTMVSADTETNTGQVTTVAIAIMAIALLGGGIFAGLARKQPDKTG